MICICWGVSATGTDSLPSAFAKNDVKGVQGAGDSMVSGFAYAIAEQHTQGNQLLKMAVSCAHASLELPGTQMCTMAGVEKRFPLTPVKRLCTF